ncbi:MAG: hypothetical protein LUE26_06630 [Alistipes sp.]|nr:hypothetical protein [Alistipes sp.]
MKILNVNGHEYKWVDFDGSIWLHRSSTWCAETMKKYKDGTFIDFRIFDTHEFLIAPIDLVEITTRMYNESFTAAH